MRAKRAVKGAGRAWCGGYHGFLAALRPQSIIHRSVRLLDAVLDV